MWRYFMWRFLQFVCSEVQMTCIWSTWCHCHPIISASVNMIYPSGTGLPSLSWKKAVKQVSCFSCCSHHAFFTLTYIRTVYWYPRAIAHDVASLPSELSEWIGKGCGRWFSLVALVLFSYKNLSSYPGRFCCVAANLLSSHESLQKRTPLKLLLLLYYHCYNFLRPFVRD